MKLNHCYQGDCRDVIDGMEADSIDAIVCDPPYGLKFMGKGWDHGVPGPEYWIKARRVAKPGAHLLAFGGTRMFHRLMVAIEDAGWEIRDTIMWVYGSGFPKSKNLDGDWNGWGTALKPAWEPIVVALFPSEAGAAAPVTVRNGDKFRNTFGAFGGDIDEAGSTFRGDSGSAARFFYCAKASRADRNEGLDGRDKKALNWSSGTQNPGSFQAEGTDRTSENHHPTVKPTELMRYLCRLVTPPGGLILDPFAGSGSTGKAAVLEGFRFVGIELEAEYAEIARARIEAAIPRQAGLEFAA